MRTIYNDLETLKANGFMGGVSVKNLKSGCVNIPNEPGVYVITKPVDKESSFLKIGTGGFFKGKDPNVSISELEANWVDNTIVVYIGKATSLKKRLKRFMDFGSGSSVGHWGGRLIWQLSYADQLQVWWKPVDENPRDVEWSMIQDFKQEYGLRPFANLQD